MRKRQSRQPKKNVSQQSLVPVPRGNLIPSQAKRVERTMVRLSGASFNLATSSGYAWITIDSTLFASSSPWTALSNLYMFVRPLYVRVTVTAARSTGTSDNPVVGFVATPDGTQVGTTAMNISTFEAPNCITRTLGPGKEESYSFRPHVAIAAYATPTNGYIPLPCPRVSLNSLPRIYYGDVLMLTPGVNLTTTASYVQVKVEFVFEFDTIDNGNIQ